MCFRKMGLSDEDGSAYKYRHLLTLLQSAEQDRELLEDSKAREVHNELLFSRGVGLREHA